MAAGVVAGDLDGEEEALGAAAGQLARPGLAAEQVGAERHDLALHAQQAGEGERVEVVLVQVLERDRLLEPFELGVGGVVHEAEGAPTPPVGVIAPAAPQRREQLVGGPAGLGEAGCVG